MMERDLGRRCRRCHARLRGDIVECLTDTAAGAGGADIDAGQVQVSSGWSQQRPETLERKSLLSSGPVDIIFALCDGCLKRKPRGRLGGDPAREMIPGELFRPREQPLRADYQPTQRY